MKIACDLHIHSCLSPCGEEDMTPNNIVNMAFLKELDAIAVTDHNRALNLPAIAALAEAAGLMLLPGLEVQTREEVHALCYFRTVDAALRFGERIYGHLPKIKNRPDFFGEQLVMDEEDEITAREELLLLQSLTLTLEELFNLAAGMDGLCVPAHINKRANSLLYVLGFLPPDIPFKTVELSRVAPAPRANLDRYHVLYSSDAHQLDAMLEREFFLDVKERSVEGIFDALTRAK